MATPKLAMIPTAYKPTKLYSVLPQSGVGDFTFARASAATRVNEDGLIETINPNFIGNELVTNGDFSNGYVGWNVSGNPSNYSIEVVDHDGKIDALHFTTPDNNSGVNQIILQSNKLYLVKFDLKVISGNVYVGKSNNRVTGSLLNPSEWTSYEQYWTANDTYFRVYSSGAAQFYLDNVSVKEVTLNNIPRLDYTDGGCPNFLLEPQRTNSVTYSENFNQWGKINCTVTSNSIVSPDGTQNADKLIATSGASNKVINQVVPANTYTASVFAKKGEFEGLFIGTGTTGAFFNLNTYSYRTHYQTAPTSYKVENYGNGWYRYSVTFTISSSNSIYIGPSDNVSTTLVITGDGSKGIYIYGAQAEVGTYPTSYIPTNGSTATRVGETCTDSGNAATFNDSEGVLMAEISALANDGTNRQTCINDNSESDRVMINLHATSNQIQGYITSGNNEQADMRYVVSDTTFSNKVAVKYKLNDCSLWVNGFEVATDNSATMPVGLQKYDFDNSGGSLPFYGKTKQLQYFDSVLTDAELETLTSWQSFLEMANGQNYTII